MKESDKFLAMFDIYKSLLDVGDFNDVNDLMQTSLDNENVTPGELKTILVITKSFKENDVIKSTRKTVLSKLEEMLGKPII